MHIEYVHNSYVRALSNLNVTSRESNRVRRHVTRFASTACDLFRSTTGPCLPYSEQSSEQSWG